MKDYLMSQIKSVFIRWLLSYFLILLIPVLFGSIIYGHALDNVRRENRRAQRQVLEQNRQNFEKQLETFYNIAYGILNGINVNKVLEPGTDGGYSSEQQLDRAILQKQLNNLRTINDSIEEVYLYESQSDSILSTRAFCRLEESRDFEEDWYGCGIEKIREMAWERTGSYGNVAVKGEKKNRLVFSYIKEMPGRTGISRVMILVYLKSAAVGEIFDISDVVMFLEWRKEDDSVIASVTKKGNSAEAISAEEMFADPQNLVFRETSERYQFDYISIIPKSYYLKGVNQMKGIMLIYILLCLGGGGMMAWSMTRKQYLPIGELLQSILGRERGKATDIRQIKYVYLDMKEGYRKSREKIKESLRIEKKYVMSEWIAGRIRSLQNPELEDWLNQIEWSEYVLIAVDVIGFETAQGEEELASEEFDMAYFIVENVFHEMLEKQYRSIEAEAGGMLLSLVSRREESDHTERWIEEDLRKRLMELQEFLNHFYQMKLQIQISDIHSGKEEIAEGFQEIQRELEEMQKRQHIKESRIEKEQQRRRDKERKASETERLVSIAKEYIEGHYQDNQLTVGYLADMLHVNISYLSREYKKRNEYGILEYINYLRFERAKELLSGEDTIKDIALQVGFFDTPPLMRLFRQMESMTPGEYRNQLKRAE